MENKEIDRKMNELWKKAAGSDYAPQSSAAPSHLTESGLETVQFLRNNFSKAESDWKRLLETKDTTIRELSAQVDEVRAHLSELKQHYQEARERLINEELSTALNLEDSRKLLDAQKKNHAREITLLKDILERTKLELQNLSGQFEALKAERDSWQRKFSDSAVTEGDLKDSSARLGAQLAEAKEAVEGTLSELLAERKNRRDAEGRIQESGKKNSELQDRLADMKANWDAERKEWRELWDRERSVWETHRAEFAVWEERLRSERQAWMAKLKDEEAKGMEYASGLANVLKESSQWSEKVTQILKLYALKGVQLPAVFVSPDNSVMKTRRTVSRMAALALAGLMFLGGFAWWLYDFRSKAHFTLLSQYSLESSNAAGLAVSKDGLWLADWEKGLVLKDAKDLSTLRILNGSGAEPFRPAAVSAYDGGAWVLDMAQLRFLKKDLKTGGMLETVKTPGPAPQGAAWDGYNLWSFDAATGLLYKYGLDPKAGVTASFELPGVKNLVSMQWVKGELWTLDAKNILRRYVLKNGLFTTVSSQVFKSPALAFWAEDGRFWTLETNRNRNGLEIKKYAVKTY
ncbi:MAG: hypothetical protein KKH28_03365 [Elusimicrobia bacterium]|nr:hypothetical protein [Elusimicrobiota bacterium]